MCPAPAVWEVVLGSGGFVRKQSAHGLPGKSVSRCWHLARCGLPSLDQGCGLKVHCPTETLSFPGHVLVFPASVVTCSGQSVPGRGTGVLPRACLLSGNSRARCPGLFPRAHCPHWARRWGCPGAPEPLGRYAPRTWCPGLDSGLGERRGSTPAMWVGLPGPSSRPPRGGMWTGLFRARPLGRGARGWENGTR